MFKDRTDAGKLLAEKLSNFKGQKDLLILGIPRGGVVVAKEVADFLNASLDIVVTRKIGHPESAEFAIAAVDENGNITKENGFLDFSTRTSYIEEAKEDQVTEIRRRLKEYRGAEAHPNFKNKVCIIVDDGIATGLTTISAIDFIKARGAKKIILAIPVIPADKMDILEKKADEVIFLESPEIFFSVGQFYKEFPQTTDREVIEILRSKLR